MPSVGVLMLFAIVGALICARARVAGGAVVFAALAVVMFVATPAGAGLPGAVSSFVSTFDHAATPVLDGKGGAG
jgi:hypothetical protein